MADQTALLNQARGGDRAAFEALQHEFESGARRFIRRLIGLTSDEDDILQKAFFALYRNLRRLETQDQMRGFLYRVIRNQCYDELRRQGRYETVSLDDGYMAETSLPSGDVEPDERAHWLLIYTEVKGVIQQLPEVQRQTLLLSIDANLTYAEIAEVMGCSLGTVKSRLHYARHNLIRRLKPETLVALDLPSDDSDEMTDQEHQQEDEQSDARAGS